MSRLGLARRCSSGLRLLLLAAFWLPVASWSAERPLNILLLSSYSQNYQSSEDLQAGLDDVLQFRKGANNFFVEYFDTARIPDEQAGRHFAEHLQSKYEGVHLDYVLVWHVSAIGFIQQHPGLFAGSKLVSFEGPRLIETGAAGNQSNWFNVVQDFDSGLAEVKRLYNPAKLLVIMDQADSNSITRRQNFERAHALHMSDVPVEYVLDLPADEVAAILRKQHPPRTAAIYLLTFNTGKGKPASPKESFSYLAADTTIPVFSFWQTLLGNGMVGGKLFSHRQGGRSLGRYLLDPASMDTSKPLDTVIEGYDWAQLEKWGIDTDLIPPDALIINRPPNLLHEYRYYLAAVLCVIAVLGALAAFLARAVHSRNQAVAALQKEREGLETRVMDRTRDLEQANLNLNARNAELARSLSEIKTLKGFIPICSYCKNVRHDKGYWQQVESYISTQTDAQFSHGICPDCVKIHHPDIGITS